MKMPRKKRWFRFSMRTMLVLTLAFGVWLGIKVREARQQKAAVEWVQQEDGAVVYKYQIDNLLQMRNRDSRIRSWLRSRLGPEFFETVDHVGLANRHISDLSQLTVLEDLSSLALIRVDCDDFTSLSEFSNLRSLQLTNVNIEDLSPLTSLTELRQLSVDGQFDDLTPLASLQNLEVLLMETSRVVDLSPLIRLVHLREVGLFSTPVAIGDLAELRQALPKCEIKTARPPQALGKQTADEQSQD
jgi:hypothetical protein